ncbi:amidoligase family protein [Desulfoscipio gibsoniae]|jgi:hypothetical protein|uniref:Putative amidoligase enzyme n=1 Tax=Desulfoscipio gibsoniae DSM 7213 TaxID=767817 RepID=R4KQ33_9FIRM|nr:amidoligase family protein [Desulfoscipio gibsoniae]AGL03642.1 Putative amidoligase enzyme [Desulfoscipio gibsoniae DSM 7213]
MKNLTFGIEIELTGISREAAAKAVAGYFGTSAHYLGGGYDKWEAPDNQGRSWFIMNDSSIRPETKRQGKRIAAGLDHRLELVSPICTYSDIETVQEIIRALRKAGAFCNRSCGLHVHVGKERFTAKTLRNLVNIVASKEDLIYQALQVDEQRKRRYCQKVKESFLEELNRRKPTELEQLADLWYQGYSGSRSQHYHSSRYHGLNLHATFNGPTVEFRLFNGTTHAGKVKAYIQFCLAVSYQALSQKNASAKKTETSNPKYTFRTWLLRLGLIGKEFETARLHLLKNLEGDSAFRNGRQVAGL